MELPQLEQNIWQVYQDLGMQVLGIDVDNSETLETILAWVNNMTVPITFPLLYQGSDVYGQYGDGYIPFNAVIDSDQILRYGDSGYYEAAIIAVIETYLPLAIIFTSHSITDDGNGDGRPDPGETAQMVVTLRNASFTQQADSVVATLSTPDPEISFIVDTVSYPLIPPASVADNSADPFIFSVAGGLQPHVVDFSLIVTAQPDNYRDTLAFSFMVGRPEIILVDDDGGDDIEQYYLNTIDTLGLVIDRWENVTQGHPPSAELQHYSKVVWFTGEATSSTISPDEQTQLAAYLDGGGNLFLSSQNAGDEIGDSSFFAEYLHAQHELNYVSNRYLDATPGDPIGDPNSTGELLVLFGGNGAGPPSSNSSVIPQGDAVAVYIYHDASTVGGIRYADQTYRVVFFAFPFESVGGRITSYGQSTPRDSALARILAWFDAPLALDDGVDVGIPTAFRLDQNYPNPFNPITTIKYGLPQESNVTLKVFDILGREVSTLVNEHQDAGYHQIYWDASGYSSGIYFYQIQAGEFIDTKKLLLLK